MIERSYEALRKISSLFLKSLCDLAKRGAGAIAFSKPIKTMKKVKLLPPQLKTDKLSTVLVDTEMPLFFGKIE